MIKKNSLQVEVSWKLFWQILVFGGLFVIIYYARNVVSIFLVAMVISIGLEPVVNFLERLKIGRLLGVILLFLLSLALLSFTAYAVAPVIIAEMAGFLEAVNGALFNLTGFSLPGEVVSDISTTLRQGLNYITASGLSSITSAIGTVITNLVLFLAMIAISFYLMISKGGTERFMEVILPDAYEKPVLTIFRRFRDKVRYWLAAQAVMSVIVGAVVAFGLYLLGVKYYIILGILAAVFELVPVIGPIIAGAVTFLVSITTSLSLGIYSLIFFFLVQQLENHVLLPIVMGKSLRVHPIIVIVALLAGGEVAGFVGIVLSVPIAVFAQEVFFYLSEERESRIVANNRPLA